MNTTARRDGDILLLPDRVVVDMITASAEQMQPLQLRRPIQRLWQSIERHENSNVREELCITCMSAEPAPRHAPNKLSKKKKRSTSGLRQMKDTSATKTA